MNVTALNNRDGIIFMYGGVRWRYNSFWNQTKLELERMSEYLVVLSDDGTKVNFTYNRAGPLVPSPRLYHTAVYSDFYGAPGGVFVFGGHPQDPLEGIFGVTILISTRLQYVLIADI